MRASILAALFAVQSESNHGSSQVSAQVLFPMPTTWNENVNSALKPVFDKLEPHKKASFEHERAIPLLHEKLGRYYHKPFSFINFFHIRLHNPYRR